MDPYIKELEKRIREVSTKRPDLKDDLIDIYQLAMEEIADGSNSYNECDLALDGIDDLLQQKTTT